MPRSKKPLGPVEAPAEVSPAVQALPDIRPAVTDIFVETLSAADKAHLEAKGYRITYLASMPRTTDVETRAWLLARAQASAEGFAPNDKDSKAALELAMRAHGLLDSKRPAVTYRAKNIEEAKELLNWDESRHSRKDTDKIASARELLRAIPGGKR